MVPTERNKIILGLALVVTGVGATEALLSETWDLAVVFGLLFALQSLLLLGLQVRRPAVPLRRDLVRWLGDRSATTGEPLERLADRCIAAYRAGMTRRDEIG